MNTYNVDKDIQIDIVGGFYNEVIKTNKRIIVTIGGLAIAMMVNGDVCFAEESQIKFLSPVKDNVCLYSEIANASLFSYDGRNHDINFVSDNTFNFLNYNIIKESYYSHKGNNADELSKAKFDDMAMAMAALPYKETLARYSVVNNINTLLLTFGNGLELNITQFPDQEEVAFSIHRDGVMLFVGSSSASDLAKKMLHVIDDPKSFSDDVS